MLIKESNGTNINSCAPVISGDAEDAPSLMATLPWEEIWDPLVLPFSGEHTDAEALSVQLILI